MSGNGSPTEKISAFIDLFLGNLVPQIRSYIKDTSHVLQIVASSGRIEEDTILASLSVSSLYTNIPNYEGQQTVKNSFSSQRPFGEVSGNFVSNHTIVALVLEKNNFSFDGRHFLQVGGTAMEIRVAPTYANIFMDCFENEHVNKYRLQPRLWGRYRDDVLLVWDHGEELFIEFVAHLNSAHPTVKFTKEHSTQQVFFLTRRLSRMVEGVCTPTSM